MRGIEEQAEFKRDSLGRFTREINSHAEDMRRNMAGAIDSDVIARLTAMLIDSISGFLTRTKDERAVRIASSLSTISEEIEKLGEEA